MVVDAITRFRRVAVGSRGTGESENAALSRRLSIERSVKTHIRVHPTDLWGTCAIRSCMDDSTAITAGFAALFVGVCLILAGVFLGGNQLIVGAGGVIMVLSVGGFVLAALEDDHGSAQTGTH